MDHVPLIHPLAGGHLDCFHFLTVVNCAVKKVHLQVLGKHIFSFLLSVHPGVGLLSHTYSSFMFTFLRNCQTDFQVAVPFHIVSSNVEGSSFPANSPACVIVFGYSYTSGCEVVFHSAFDLHSPND